MSINDFLATFEKQIYTLSRKRAKLGGVYAGDIARNHQ